VTASSLQVAMQRSDRRAAGGFGRQDARTTHTQRQVLEVRKALAPTCATARDQEPSNRLLMLKLVTMKPSEP
jgi:hypothetical protein